MYTEKMPFEDKEEVNSLQTNKNLLNRFSAKLEQILQAKENNARQKNGSTHTMKRWREGRKGGEKEGKEEEINLKVAKYNLNINTFLNV